MPAHRFFWLTLFACGALLCVACGGEEGGGVGAPCDRHDDCESDICAHGACLSSFADDDGDGLDNAWEHRIGSDPLSTDSDGDGTPDAREAGDSPDRPLDSDGDGLPDVVDPRDGRRDPPPMMRPPPEDTGRACNSNAECEGGPCVGRQCYPTDGDLDMDGLSNGDEVRLGSNPINGDSDGDGKGDAEEVGADTFRPTDTDSDGRPDLIESASIDSDNDGTPDEQDPD